MCVVGLEGVRARAGDEGGVLLEQRVTAGRWTLAGTSGGEAAYEGRRLRREAAERVRAVVEQQVAELMSHNVVNIFRPEPLTLGGLFATRKICDMVDAHYGVVAPHSAQGPVCSAACMHLNASLPNFFIHEIFDEFHEEWEKDIIVNGVEVVDGYIQVSDRPGLGIDLNTDEIAKHPYQQENYIPLFKSGWERRESNK